MKPSVFDAHVDTLLKLPDAESFLQGNKVTHVDQPRAKRAGVTQLMTAVCAEAATNQMTAFHYGISLYREIKERSSIELLLLLEGCQPLMEIENREEIVDLLSFASLTWNGENSLGGGIGADTGLTEAGRNMALQLHNAGVILDVSHLCDRSRVDLLSLGIRTVATHCNCRSILDIPRNLPDDDIREIASSGGVVGVTFVPDFLGEDASLETIADHLEHIVEITDIAHAGMGSDFDGTKCLPAGVRDCSVWPEIFELLDRRGWDQKSLEAVAGDNWRRITMKY
ncbi:MAG: membrane dipeptidase [Candidatus Aegiribacteria sp.]|nr:membrane dipeptidase [Candidatus Aegiribacteria sp.]